MKGGRRYFIVGGVVVFVLVSMVVLGKMVQSLDRCLYEKVLDMSAGRDERARAFFRLLKHKPVLAKQAAFEVLMRKRKGGEKEIFFRNTMLRILAMHFKDEEMLCALRRSADEETRESLAYYLGRLGSEKADRAMEEWLKEEKSRRVRREIERWMRRGDKREGKGGDVTEAKRKIEGGKVRVKMYEVRSGGDREVLLTGGRVDVVKYLGEVGCSIAVKEGWGGKNLVLEVDEDDRGRFRKMISGEKGKRVGFEIGGEMVMAPQVAGVPLSGKMTCVLRMSDEEVEKLAKAIEKEKRSGAETTGVGNGGK